MMVHRGPCSRRKIRPNLETNHFAQISEVISKMCVFNFSSGTTTMFFNRKHSGTRLESRSIKLCAIYSKIPLPADSSFDCGSCARCNKASFCVGLRKAYRCANGDFEVHSLFRKSMKLCPRLQYPSQKWIIAHYPCFVYHQRFEHYQSALVFCSKVQPRTIFQHKCTRMDQPTEGEYLDVSADHTHSNDSIP